MEGPFKSYGLRHFLERLVNYKNLSGGHVRLIIPIQGDKTYDVINGK